jgi:FKBP-type peptidyl-prolyl cis-trans isomerase SlyD|tara:strand:+ start:841 stop:1395 length:555 start_codon:yes stop_codon:yes gene_type:complete
VKILTTIDVNTVVTVHYTGTFPDSGEMFDTSRQGDPLTFLVGHRQMIPGFEREIMGAKTGESRSFTLEPEDAYGHPSDALVQEVPRSMFPEGMPIDLGMMLMSDAGPFRIVAITDSTIKCDFNPPMSGKILHFDVEVVGVRAADESEIAHGHVHGPGGVQHDSEKTNEDSNPSCKIDKSCCGSD